MPTFRQDLRYALRWLAKKPGFSAIIIITLALGIGANAAIFSIVSAVILKPLPFRDAGRLVHIWESHPKGGRYRWGSDQGFIIVRPATYYDWKNQSQSFEGMTAYSWRSVLITGAGPAQSLHAHEVDRGFFETLGVQPELGRTFQADDYTAGPNRIVVLSHSLWASQFGEDPRIVGKSILLDNAAHTVAGVMPEGFYPTRWETPKLWLPLSLGPADQQSRVLWRLFTFARLKPGVSFDRAQQEMDLISEHLSAAYPKSYDNMGAVLTPVTGFLFSQYERLFYILLGAVALVLLIACANVANLLLAQATQRDREFCLRAALGASRGRLISQVLTEGLVLSGAGGALGIALAIVSIRPLILLLPASSRVPRIASAHVDWTVLVFTLGVAMLAGLLFGLIPAFRASRPNLNDALKERGRSGSAGRAAKRIGDLLVIAEMAVSVVLLVAAGLLIRSFLTLMRSDPGLNPERVLALNIEVPAHRYGKYQTGGANPTRVRLYDAIEHRLRDLPGVRAAALTASLPLRHGPNPWGMRIEGRPEPTQYGSAAGQKSHGTVSVQRVTPGYFDTFGIRITRGRGFDARDAAGAPGVALINETNARRYFGNEDPVGKTITLDMTSYFPRAMVIGVVADSRLNGVEHEVYPQVFLPMAQWPGPGGWVAVRTAVAPASMAPAVQQALRDVDRDLAVTQVSTMQEVLGESLWRQRLTAVLLGGFAALAALLAGAGIYAVFSYMVTGRAKELGVRMALGASRGSILGLVMGSALRLAAIGLAIGIAGAVASARLVSSWLYGVQATDPATIAEVSILLFAIAAVACYVPARRAMRVDPVTALRDL